MTIILASAIGLSLGILLLGIAAVKEAFTSTVVTRVEAGNVAVETRARASTCPTCGGLRGTCSGVFECEKS